MCCIYDEGAGSANRPRRFVNRGLHIRNLQSVLLALISGLLAVAACDRSPTFRRESDARADSGADWFEVIETEPDAAVVTDAALRAAIKATGKPWRIRDRGTEIEMLLVPSGSFVMGKSLGDTAATDRELPAHEVTLTDPYYLGRFEVTQSQWIRIMGSNPSSCVTIRDRPSLVAAKMKEGMTEREAEAAVPDTTPLHDHPVDSVSWSDASDFCSRAGLRLPTEAEWERACRAGLRTARYGQLGDVAWYGGNSGGATHAVGKKKANSLGIHDMLGNVGEWVNDWYDHYSPDLQTNPTGPGWESFRVVRGGSYSDDANVVRSSYRSNDPPGRTGYYIGFRVARSP